MLDPPGMRRSTFEPDLNRTSKVAVFHDEDGSEAMPHCSGSCGVAGSSQAEQLSRVVAEHQVAAVLGHGRQRRMQLLHRRQVGIDVRVVGAPEELVLADQIALGINAALARIHDEPEVLPDVLAWWP